VLVEKSQLSCGIKFRCKKNLNESNVSELLNALLGLEKDRQYVQGVWAVCPQPFSSFSIRKGRSGLNLTIFVQEVSSRAMQSLMINDSGSIHIDKPSTSPELNKFFQEQILDKLGITREKSIA